MIEIIDTLEKLDAQKSVWQRLERNTGMRVQQTFQWTRAGWLYFNSHEVGAKLQIVKWRRNNADEYVYFPFFLDGKRTLRFINDLHCDANNVVCRQDVNLHYAFLETIEWIKGNSDVRRVHLRQMPSGCAVIEYFAVLARGSIVYRDHGYSWLDVHKGVEVHDYLVHFKKKDRKKFQTLLRRAEDFNYRVYAQRTGDMFPRDMIGKLCDRMVSSGRRTAQYLDPKIFEFAEEMFNEGLLEVASLARGEDVGIAAFRLIKDNRYLCWIVLNDDPQLPTLLHAKYIADKALQHDFIYDFGVGPYGYKLITFKPRPAPTFSLCMAKSPWGQLMGVKNMLIRYAKDYLKPLIRKEY